MVRRLSSRDWATAAILMVAAALFFGWRIHFSILAPVADNAVFGADAGEAYRALAKQRYWGLSHIKHPLAVLYAMMTVAPLRLAGLPLALAVPISFGTCIGAGLAALYLTLRQRGLALAGAASLVLLTWSSFSLVTVGSVVETYGVTLAAICLALLAESSVSARTGRAATILSIAPAALAGWANLPAAAYMAFGVIRRLMSERPWGVLAVAAIGAMVAVAPTLLLGAVLGFQVHEKVVGKFGSMAHFSDPAALADLAVSAGAYLQVSPAGVLRCRYVAGEFAGLLSDPLRLVALLGWWGLIAAGLIVGLRERALRRQTLAAVAVLGALLVFYTWFHPAAFLLYGPQFVPAIALLTMPALMRAPRLWMGTAALAALCLALNAPLLMVGPLNNFESLCPPALRVHGGL